MLHAGLHVLTADRLRAGRCHAEEQGLDPREEQRAQTSRVALEPDVWRWVGPWGWEHQSCPAKLPDEGLPSETSRLGCVFLLMSLFRLFFRVLFPTRIIRLGPQCKLLKMIPLPSSRCTAFPSPPVSVTSNPGTLLQASGGLLEIDRITREAPQTSALPSSDRA